MSRSAALMLALVLLAAGTTIIPAGTDWPGFRGVEQQGRSEWDGGPFHWAGFDDARWVVGIDGRGSSSPVVADGRVYVTTAYVASRGVLLDRALTWLAFVLICLAGILGLQIAVDLCRPRLDAQGAPAQLFPAVFFGLNLLLLAVFAVFGASALNYERCEIRSWLGASIVVSLAAALSEFNAPSRSYRRVWMGLGLVLFGILVVVAMPFREHAFKIGLFSKKAEMVILVGAVPAIVGAASLLRFAVARRNTGRSRSTSFLGRYPTQVALALLGCLVGIVLLAANFRIPGVIISSKWAVSGFVIFVFSATWTVFLMARDNAGTDGSSAGSEDVRRRASLPRLVLAGSTCALVVAAAVFVFLRALADTQFFTYQLRNPSWTPIPNWFAFFAFAVAAAAALVFAIYRQPKISRSLQRVFGLACLALGLVIFVHANYLNTKDFMTRAIIAVDAESGDAVWTREVFDGPVGTFHVENSSASPTPTVRRGTIYAYFGDSGVVAVDADGRLKWTNKDVRFDSIYGAGVSPVAHGDYVIVSNGTPKDPRVFALDAETGTLRWEQEIAGETLISGNSRTPWVTEIDGKETVLIWGFGGLEGFDLATGERLWVHDVGEAVLDMVASVIADEQRLYLVAARETVAFELAALGGSRSPEVWRRRVGGANVSSPVVKNGMLFMVSDTGKAVCLEAATGEVLWRERLPGTYHASLTVIGDHVYYSNTDGTTTVVAAETPFREIARNEFEEGHNASFAPVKDHIFIRTTGHLLRVDANTKFAGRREVESP